MSHHRPIVRAALLVLAAATCNPLFAQGAPLVMPGALVRIAHTATYCRSPVVGDFVSADADSVTIVSRARNDSLPCARLGRTSIVSFDVGRRVGEHKAVGAVSGLLVGATAGSILGWSTSCSHCDGDYRAFGAVAGGVAGGLLGVIVGTVVGAFQPHYEWSPVR
ncbi:MAG: hypothetical protein JWN53_36 [Gemmatimonadetes bacterium]|nr:hypothetical protein [Gemmatimonadota bacterium]